MSELQDQVRINLVDSLYESAINAHSDAQSNFTNLDTKAQNCAVIVGVFLAGTLALLNGNAINKLLAITWGLPFALLTALMVLLVASIICSLAAMFIREVPLIEVEMLATEVNEILDDESGQDLIKMYENYLLGQVRKWENTSEKLRVINLKKSRYIFKAQIALAVAPLFLTALLMLTIIHMPVAHDQTFQMEQANPLNSNLR